MRNRSFAVVSVLLFLQFISTAGAAASAADEKTPAASAAKPSDALWRFNTHG